MSDATTMRRILGSKREAGAPLSHHEEQALLAGHLEAVDEDARRDLSTHEGTLRTALTHAEASSPERAGDAAARAYRSMRGLTATGDLTEIAGGQCMTLDSPRFTIESPEETVTNDAGDILRFTRSDATARTLEVAAVTGALCDGRWPGSQTFLIGFNKSSASIGGVLALPDHGGGTELRVTARLGVERRDNFVGGGWNPQSASYLLSLTQGDGRLPLRGNAVGWCRAGLSLHSSQGSTRSGVEFVSGWVNRDAGDSEDLTVDGRFSLTHNAAPTAGTSTVAVFVDVTCFAGAEESDELKPALAIFNCRNAPTTIDCHTAQTDSPAFILLPTRIRVLEVTARLCVLPVL
jgi:hypothetical protein